MRHRKYTCKLGRNSSHRRCLIATMLKSLVKNGRIFTTEAKAKAIRSHAEKLITIAKEGTLSSRRQVVSKTMLKKESFYGNKSSLKESKNVLSVLFSDLAVRFSSRNGGYTRIVKTERRRGDSAQMCLLEFLDN